MSEYMPPIGLHEKPAWKSAEKMQSDAHSRMKPAAEKSQMGSVTGSASVIRTATPGEAASKTQKDVLSGFKPVEAGEKAQMGFLPDSIEETAKPGEVSDKTQFHSLSGVKPTEAEKTHLGSISASVQETAKPGKVPYKTKLDVVPEIEAATQMEILEAEDDDFVEETQMGFTDGDDYDDPKEEETQTSKPERPLKMRPMAFKAIDNGDGTLRLEKAPGFENKLTRQECYTGFAAVYMTFASFLIWIMLAAVFVNYLDKVEVHHFH
ncbi:hypothetical protein L596_016325 [Steinernema carpocapsae]|uniref:Uncharacterized protein n=1 Tax=Steinernema carpocapsae TaxID=34508 RepID=A0A4U5NI99_STECR|nr:hypothetical protein L596_016325 [Steinernema carpocapsae]